MEEDILKHLVDAYPEEGCGVIINKKGISTWVPCTNVALNKFNSFDIAAAEYASLCLQGDIEAIIHSHPDAPSNPSFEDKISCDHMQIPYHIYSIPSGVKTIYTPKAKTKESYVGRVYEFGVKDCWTLVRDWYLKEFEYKLPMIKFDEEFYDKGIDYFGDNLENWGGFEVDTPQRGDVVLFKIMNDIENHCGVYVGNGKYIHHMKDRLSSEDSIYSGWGKYITRYVRCKKLFS